MSGEEYLSETSCNITLKEFICTKINALKYEMDIKIDAIKEALKKIDLNAGGVNPGFSVMALVPNSNNSQISSEFTYLCYTNEYYKQ